MMMMETHRKPFDVVLECFDVLAMLCMECFDVLALLYFH